MSKRVLFVTDSLGNGGAERQLLLLAENLPPSWEKRIWSLDDGPFLPYIYKKGIGVIVSKRVYRFDILPAISLWKLICKWKPDIVHTWGWMSTAASIPICKFYKIPLIDGSIRSGQKPLKRTLLQEFVMNFADLVIANSCAGLSAWKIDKHRGRVVYNGFDPQRFHLTQREPQNDGLFRVIMTGRMVKEKDYPTFIRAARLLSREDKTWHFIGVGDGTERKAYQLQADDLVREGIFKFPEPSIEVLHWVRRADIGVLLTHPICAEGCSNSIMEYMACGLPVVCTNTGGNAELVLENQTGLLVPPQNPQVVADALRAIREHGLAVQMGEEGRKRLFELFSVDSMVQNMVKIYNEVLSHYKI